ALGGLGAALAWQDVQRNEHTSNGREALMMYGSLGILSLWGSFGPDAYLYAVLYRAVPLFTFLRAPSRFGLLLVFVLAIFSSLALKRLAPGGRRGLLYSLGFAMVAMAELNVVPFPWERALPVSTNYRILSGMPRAAVAEFPFYGERIAFPLHAQYMV